MVKFQPKVRPRRKKRHNPLATWDKVGKGRNEGCMCECKVCAKGWKRMKKDEKRRRIEGGRKWVVEEGSWKGWNGRGRGRSRHDLNAGQSAGGRWYRIYQVSSCNRSWFVFKHAFSTAPRAFCRANAFHLDQGAFPFDIRCKTSIRFYLTRVTSPGTLDASNSPVRLSPRCRPMSHCRL